MYYDYPTKVAQMSCGLSHSAIACRILVPPFSYTVLTGVLQMLKRQERSLHELEQWKTPPLQDFL